MSGVGEKIRLTTHECGAIIIPGFYHQLAATTRKTKGKCSLNVKWQAKNGGRSCWRADRGSRGDYLRLEKQGRSAGNVSVDKKMHSLCRKDIHLTHTHTPTSTWAISIWLEKGDGKAAEKAGVVAEPVAGGAACLHSQAKLEKMLAKAALRGSVSDKRFKVQMGQIGAINENKQTKCFTRKMTETNERQICIKRSSNRWQWTPRV